MQPTIGRIVLYNTDGRGGYRYSLPAIVVRTAESTDPKAIEDGKVKALTGGAVDLLVFSCGGESYGEDAVPEATVSSDQPRTWRWPPRA